MMELLLPKDTLLKLLVTQIKFHFLISSEEEILLEKYLQSALDKCEINFLSSRNKYFVRDMGGQIIAHFNPYHSVQYMILLYYLSHEIYIHEKATTLCDKLYYLNKLFNSVDLFYAIELPDKFGAEHPLGSVMGRAEYSDGFFFYQGCTVGGTYGKNGEIYYPQLGRNVQMFANSSILGKCQIGDNVKIGAGALVKNENIPSDSLVFGQSPNLIIKHIK